MQKKTAPAIEIKFTSTRDISATLELMSLSNIISMCCFRTLALLFGAIDTMRHLANTSTALKK